MKRLPKKILLGCLFAPVGLLVLGLLLVGIAKVQGVPEPKVVSRQFQEPVPERVRTAIEPRSSLPTERFETVKAAIRADLDLEWGTFYIESGPAERGITVDADYDEALYALEQEYDMKDGVPIYRLRFRSKVSMLRRAIAGTLGDNDGVGDNEITIFLPEDVPLDLRVRMKGGDGEIQLGGLTLTNLVTDFNMGSYAIEMRQTNPVPMERASFSVGMGELSLDDMSAMRAQLIEIKGGMGEVRADFGNSLLNDTAVVARMRMGELNLRIPDDALYDPDSDLTAFMGEVGSDGGRRRLDGDPELAHRLYVKGSVVMGELAVDEFRGRRAGGDDLR